MKKQKGNFNMGKGTKFLLVILGVIIAALIIFWLSINMVAGYFIQKYASEALGTNVSVSGVNISVFKGKASIKSLKIANPPGFKYPDIFSLDNISIQVDTSTLRSNTIVIDSLIINSPHLYYELTNDGRSNLGVLQNNLKKLKSDKQNTDQNKSEMQKQLETQDESKTKKPSKKIIIKKLVISNMAVNAQVAPLGDKELKFNISEIDLNNLGQESGGKTAKQIVAQVLKVLTEKAATEYTQVKLKGDLKDTADKVKDSLKDAANSLKCKLNPSSCN